MKCRAFADVSRSLVLLCFVSFSLLFFTAKLYTSLDVRLPFFAVQLLLLRRRSFLSLTFSTLFI